MPGAINMTGMKFGRLTVLDTFRVQGSRRQWLCRCECGVEKYIAANSMRRGLSTSCGCFHREQLSQHSSSHRKTNSSEYRAWSGMIQRCTNKSNPAFSGYGGRGIFVCDRWLNSFENFARDMGAKPSPLHSIDRIDNDGPYSPENCRWATRAEQNKNTRRAKRFEFNGKILLLSDIAQAVGIRPDTLRARIGAYKMTIEDATTRGLGERRKR